MPKIRGVKPDLWTDEDFVEVSAFARLLWMGIWNYACDNGHLADKSKQIKMRVLPTDDVNCAELLRELATQGLIERTDGWITVPNLTRHQKVDRRYFTTCDRPGCEPPDGGSQRETRRAHGGSTSGTRSAHAGDSTGARGDGEVMVKGSDGDRRDKPRPAQKRATQLASDFTPSDAVQETARSLGVDLRREWPKFCDHHRAKGSTFKDWDAALRNWVRKAAEYGGNVTPLTRTDDQGRQILPPLPPSSPFGGGS